MIAAAFAISLTVYFWSPLWTGGTLIGGDLFPYFFPQKAFLADEIQSGRWPLWNSLTGHGYPVIAESQTGVCYPPDLIAYRFLSLTPAYNAIQIVHYIAAFLGTWLLAKRLGAGTWGALLAATSFVYGWFPPRICLEWAIVTGAYLPWVVWCAESYLQQPRTRWLLGLCGLLTLQLLAGHFHLAFITQLLLAIYAPVRWWLRTGDMSLLPRGGEGGRRPDEGVARGRGIKYESASAKHSPTHPNPLPHGGEGTKQYAPRWWFVWLAILFAFPLAAVQLLPTWELKQRSQRADVSEEHRPGYGHLPPLYWSQAVAPWYWYTQEIDPALLKLPSYAGAGTNKIEAHLYFGLLPLVLAVGGVLMTLRRSSETDRVLRLWMLLGLAFLIYTPGWLLPVTQHLPGFNFFRGPGRYGIVTALAVALVAGVTFDRWMTRLSLPLRRAVAIGVLAITIAELGWVANQVRYHDVFVNPVVERRLRSDVRLRLARESQPVRLFAPMANVANLLDVSSTPVYLGIGPSEYFDPQFTMPAAGPNGGFDPNGNPVQLAWLEHAGVTHILSLERISTSKLPVELVWTGPDALLTPIFNRTPADSFYLYRLKPATGRVTWEDSTDKTATAEITTYSPHEIRLRVNSAAGGRVVLRDLAYPGWIVSVDGQPSAPETAGMFRAVAVDPGEHDIVWSYRPASVFWGAVISIATLSGLLIVSVSQRRLHQTSSNA